MLGPTTCWTMMLSLRLVRLMGLVRERVLKSVQRVAPLGLGSAQVPVGVAVLAAAA